MDELSVKRLPKTEGPFRMSIATDTTVLIEQDGVENRVSIERVTEMPRGPGDTVAPTTPSESDPGAATPGADYVVDRIVGHSTARGEVYGAVVWLYRSERHLRDRRSASAAVHRPVLAHAPTRENRARITMYLNAPCRTVRTIAHPLEDSKGEKGQESIFVYCRRSPYWDTRGNKDPREVSGLGVARALCRRSRCGVLGRGAGGPDRGRRHRRHREALADHREDILYAAELRVMLEAFTLPRGGGLAERRDGRLQLLHLVHPLARLQQRLLNRRGDFGPLEGASALQGRERGLLAEAFRGKPAERLRRGRSRLRSGSVSAFGTDHHADARGTRGGGRKSHGTGLLS